VATTEGKQVEEAKTVQTATIVLTTGNFQVLLESSVDII
jgi:hypothetical protein